MPIWTWAARVTTCAWLKQTCHGRSHSSAQTGQYSTSRYWHASGGKNANKLINTLCTYIYTFLIKGSMLIVLLLRVTTTWTSWLVWKSLFPERIREGGPKIRGQKGQDLNNSSRSSNLRGQDSNSSRSRLENNRNRNSSNLRGRGSSSRSHNNLRGQDSSSSSIRGPSSSSRSRRGGSQDHRGR